PARAAAGDGRGPRRPRLLPAPVAVHRQRRNDRLRRRPAPGRRPARRPGGARDAALGDGVAAAGVGSEGIGDWGLGIGKASAFFESPIPNSESRLTMDKVFIEGLEIEALIGIYDWERRIRQTLVFDLAMGFGN